MSDNKPSYKDIIKEEYIKCATSPEYFMRKYCYIEHPVRGRLLFNLYPFQAKVLELFKSNPFDIVLKSRQMGISTLVAGYSLWLMLFHKNKKILCIATTQNTSKNMVTKVAFMYKNLPSWLQEKDKNGKYAKPQEDSKLTLKLNNDSEIKATSSASDSARSLAVSLLIIDEAAFVDGIEEIWASAQQTLATGGGAIVLSTPNGVGNWFHKTWVKAETKENKFLAIKLRWNLHPERNQKWRDDQDIELGDPRIAAQECDCEFNNSGNTFFLPEHLDYYMMNVTEPIEKRGLEKDYWLWEQIDRSRQYMIVADVSRGDGSDYSAFHVIDIQSNSQVAEYRGKLGTVEYGKFLVAAATEWNNALLVVENLTWGWSTIETILELDYKNFYFSPKSENADASSYAAGYQDPNKMTPGFIMSKTTRPDCLSKMREYIHDRSATIRSKRLVEEMKVFMWKGTKPEAQYGYNDDLVMPFSMGMYLRDTSLRFRQQNVDITKAMLNSISTTKPIIQNNGYNQSNFIQNPYSQNINGQDESLRWLL